jgi:2-phosphoglycerate kinase
VSQPRRLDPLPLGEDAGLPYSKGVMARALIATGVSRMRAYELALRVETDLRARGASSVPLERLEELAVEVLGDPDGTEAIDRLRRYSELRSLDLPILVLVGGATGTGKSTVATEVAHRLGITRVTSTDFVRQTLRAFFSPEFMPSVHHSSFEAGTALPAAEKEAGDPLLVGFLDQTRHVLVGVQASLDRAMQEGWSMVLEGVHLVPGMVAAPIDEALVVHVVLEIENEDIHAQHFWIRDTASEGARAHDKYLAHLADIRHIQDFIVDEARKNEVRVVQNGNMEEAIGTVMELVLERAAALQRA